MVCFPIFPFEDERAIRRGRGEGRKLMGRNIRMRKQELYCSRESWKRRERMRERMRERVRGRGGDSRTMRPAYSAVSHNFPFQKGWTAV